MATAIEILCTSEKLKQLQFQSAEATVEFIRIFDKLFDVGNSKNLNGVGFKAPLMRKTIAAYLKLFDEAKTYILNLKIKRTSQRVVKSKIKTGYISFVINNIEVYKGL